MKRIGNIRKSVFWLKAATKVFRQRITMLWLFYFTTATKQQEYKL